MKEQSMNSIGNRIFALSLITVLALGLPLHAVAQDGTPMADASPMALPAGVTVVASGLSNPRGLSWGADGTLYLAQAGVGGETVLVEAEGFTALGGETSSVVSLADGCATPVAEDIHSVLWQEAGWIWGAMDVEVLGDSLYVLVSGSGPTWGTPDLHSGIYRVNDDGSLTLAADIGGWLANNPPKFAAPDYAGQDGSQFDMEPYSDGFLVSIADGGHIVYAIPDGAISLFADLSENHMVPTGIAVDDEMNAYVGFETTPPYPVGSSKVVQITPDGTVSDFWTGLTAVTDVEMSPDGVLYAAEMSINNSDEAPFLSSDSGQIVRQTGPDSLEAVVTDAPPPVGLGFDADGALYVSYPGFGPDTGEGLGVVIKIEDTSTPVSLAGFVADATCM